MTKVEFPENDGATGCWNWTGEMARSGGAPQYKKHSAGRYLWQAFYGDLPEQVHVQNACGNRHCVRPAHQKLLELKDMYKLRDHCKLVKGCQNGKRAKLNWEAVHYIREHSELSLGTLAIHFNTTRSTVWAAHKHITWREDNGCE